MADVSMSGATGATGNASIGQSQHGHAIAQAGIGAPRMFAARGSQPNQPPASATAYPWPTSSMLGTRAETSEPPASRYGSGARQ